VYGRGGDVDLRLDLARPAEVRELSRAWSSFTAAVGPMGVLRNLRATCYADKRIVALLKLNGVEYTNTSIVVSRRIVAANGPDAAETIAQRFFEVLRKR
jgi:hypothetical protein